MTNKILRDKYIKQFDTAKFETLLGEVTYWRTYSRNLWDEKRKERWNETVGRVVNGVFEALRTHCITNGRKWDNDRAERTAKEMFLRILHFKFTPPGRGLYAMGTDAVEAHGGAVLNNCGFLSTRDPRPDVFAKLMNLTMLGVGVGYDTLGAGKAVVVPPKPSQATILIEDTRQGWVDSVEELLASYFMDGRASTINFDYSAIRPAGKPIKRFGGVSSGPEPLKRLHSSLRDLCDSYAGKRIDSTFIVDACNLIGRCVVAGNVRRSAQIALGQEGDREFLYLKEDFGKVAEYRAFSNNSIRAHVGMDYSKAAQLTARTGEPGYFWLDNARMFGRMNGQVANRTDFLAMGTNPSLRAGTRLLTSEGVRTIETLEGKTVRVPNLNGEWSDATCFLSGKGKQLYEIKLGNGAVYHCTAEHKWPVYTPQGYVKCETTDLKPGHALPVNVQRESLPEVPSVGDYIDGLLIGWLYGDGWRTVREDRVQYGFMFSKADSSVMKVLQPRLAQIVGKDVQGSDSETGTEFNLSHPNLQHYMRSFGVDHKSKGLPSIIWSGCSEVFRRGFIDGLFSSDGSINSSYKASQVALVSAHKELAEDVSELLGFYGITSTIAYRKVSKASFPNGKVYDRTYDRYTLKISRRAHIQHFRSVFQLTHESKQDQLMSIDIQYTPGYRSLSTENVEIVRVTPTSLFEDVWDITVHDTTHCFALGHCITGNCSEQTLEDGELCCLVETYPAKHETLDDYLKTLKLAYLYAKAVTLVPTGFPDTDEIIARNRRIGCSMSGVVQAIQKFGATEFLRWCDRGYDSLTALDASYSDWLGIPESIKRTSVKPSGTVSILANASPGIHYPHSEYYIRRVRFASNSPILPQLKQAGYNVVPEVYGQELGKENTMVVEFPIHEPYFSKGKQQASMWEQLALTAAMQRYWADNQVSVTIHFTEAEAKDIPLALEIYQHQLKSVSFLPYDPHQVYQLAPYEEISKEHYDYLAGKLLEVVLPYDTVDVEQEAQPKGCDSDTCELPKK